MAHSPIPWRVQHMEYSHRKGSPACLERCGMNGERPIRIEQWPADGGETECHVLTSEFIEDVLATNGDHVICTGHEYNDGGYVSAENAAFIVRAVNSHEALVNAARQALQSIELGLPYVYSEDDHVAASERALRAALKLAEG